MSGTITNVSDHIAGSELSAAVVATDTTLPVVNVNAFDLDGGYLNIGGTLSNRVLTGGEQFAYTYTLPEDADGVDIAPEDASGDLDLDGALANPYDAGEPVYQVDANGKLFVQRFAYYLEPDGEDELKATVPIELVPFLPEGPRTEDTAEQIEAVDKGTGHALTGIVGRPAMADLNSVTFSTSPDGTGQRVEMDGDGLRVIDADETTAVNLTPELGLEIVGGASAVPASRHKVTLISPVDGSEMGHLFGYETGSGVGRTFAVELTASGLGPGEAKITLSANASSAIDAVDVSAPSGFRYGGNDILTESNSSTDLSDVTPWQDWSPTLTGWSANPATGVYRYKQIGKMVVVQIRQPTDGTSNATTKTISLPVTAATIANMQWDGICAATDNGIALTTPSKAVVNSAGTTINFAKDYSTASGGWTNSGAHRIRTCHLIYEAA